MDISKLIGLDKLDAILGRIEKRPLNIFVSQCLKERDRSLNCEACQAACPVQAVDLSAGVEVDFNRCIDCGICVNICPTGAFESRLTEDYFLSGIKNSLKSARLVGFSCRKEIEAAGQSASEVEVPCLGRVSETMLIGAAVFGADKVWLNTSLCADCDCREGAALAARTVAGVDKLLEAWGRRVRFSLTARPPDDDSVAGPVENIGEEYNRRELLVKLKREALVAGLGLAQGRIDQAAEVFEPAAEGVFDYRLPRKRELLLQLTKKLGEPPETNLSVEDLSFYGLAVAADSCNLCGNCAVFCPTRALKVEEADEGGRLRFNVSRCLGCDLCVQVCSPRAMSVDARVYPADIYDQDDRVLVELNRYECEKCKQPFASDKKAALCHFCGLREGKLHDDSWS